MKNEGTENFPDEYCESYGMGCIFSSVGLRNDESCRMVCYETASDYDFYDVWPYDSDDQRRTGPVLCRGNIGIDLYRCLFAALGNASYPSSYSGAGLSSDCRRHKRLSRCSTAGQSGDCHIGAPDYREQPVWLIYRGSYDYFQPEGCVCKPHLLAVPFCSGVRVNGSSLFFAQKDLLR